MAVLHLYVLNIETFLYKGLVSGVCYCIIAAIHKIIFKRRKQSIWREVGNTNVRAGVVLMSFSASISCVLTFTKTTYNGCVMSDNGRNLWLLLTWSNFLDHCFRAFLELAVFGGVDERIDTAVREHQNHHEVVPPTSKVERVTEEIEKIHNLDWWPAREKTAAYDQRRNQCVAPCFAYQRVTSPCHLKEKQESLANAKVSVRQPWYIGRNSLNRPPLRIAYQYQHNKVLSVLNNSVAGNAGLSSFV